GRCNENTRFVSCLKREPDRDAIKKTVGAKSCGSQYANVPVPLIQMLKSATAMQQDRCFQHVIGEETQNRRCHQCQNGNVIRIAQAQRLWQQIEEGRTQSHTGCEGDDQMQPVAEPQGEESPEEC